MASIVNLSTKPPYRYKLPARALLGRAPANTVVVNDPRVSQTHAEIRRLFDGSYQLINLNATNGTSVAGKSVTKTVLRDGDRIRIGETDLLFESGTKASGERPVSNTLRTISTEEVQLAVRELPEAWHRTPGLSISFRPSQEIENPAQLRENYDKLRGAYEVIRAIGALDSLDQILDRIVEVATELLCADRAAILLTDRETGDLAPRAAMQREHESGQMVLSATLIREVARTQTAILCEDIEADSRFNRATSVMVQGIRSAMCVPLVNEKQLAGVIYLDSRISSKVFSPAELEVLTGIAGQAAVAVRNAALERYIGELEERRLSAIRALVSGASHFINNPLAVVRANLSTLAQWASDLSAFHRVALEHGDEEVLRAGKQLGIDYVEAEIGPMTDETIGATRRIAEIVQAMRLFEQHCGEDILFDLGEVLAETARAVAEHVEHVQLHWHVDANLGCRGSRERISKVFDSLISNAVQAIPPGDRDHNWIAVIARRHGKEAIVTIADTGCGIGRGEELTVFDPFFTSKTDGSLGLGLAVAAEIVGQHAGSISAEARDGGGTVMTVRLPLGN